jgi:hypothetical protein
MNKTSYSGFINQNKKPQSYRVVYKSRNNRA